MTISPEPWLAVYDAWASAYPADDRDRMEADPEASACRYAFEAGRPAERVEVPVVQPGEVAAVEQAITGLRDVAASLELALSRVAAAPRPAPQAPAVPPPPRRPAASTPQPERRAALAEGDSITLGKAQRAVLGVLAQFPEGRTKIQLALLSGYSVKSSGYGNTLGALRTAGLINRGSPIQITPEGMIAIGDDWEPLPAGEAFIDRWMTQLGKAERAILRYLLDSYPEPRSKDEVSAATGYSVTSSGFGNALGKLRSLELINRDQGILANDEFAAEVGRAGSTQ